MPMNELLDEYLRIVTRLLETIALEERETLTHVADAIYSSLERGGIVHIFGSGHSELLAREFVGRAGGLVPVNAVIDKMWGRAERMEGYADAVLGHYLENAQLLAGEVFIVVSNSGRNPLPIELALEAKRMGLITVALTSVGFSKTVDSRHSSGQKLYEVCDYVLDNKGALGDAVLDVPGFDVKIGATSTIAGAFILQMLAAVVALRFAARDVRPPVYHSLNLDTGHEINGILVNQYRSRLYRD